MTQELGPVKSLLQLLCVLPATLLAREPDPAKTDRFLAGTYGVFVLQSTQC